MSVRYIAVCGPMRQSSIRLTLSQAFNGIGTVVGPLLASHTFFLAGNGDDLSSVQWVSSSFSRVGLTVGISCDSNFCVDVGCGILVR